MKRNDHLTAARKLRAVADWAAGKHFTVLPGELELMASEMERIGNGGPVNRTCKCTPWESCKRCYPPNPP